MNPHFLRGFIQGAIFIAALFAAWSIRANATEFFPTKAEALAASHGRHVAWICTGKDRRYYVGAKGEQHCSGHQRTMEREVMRSGERSTKPDSRPRPASLAGAAKRETVGVAPPAAPLPVPVPPIPLADWQEAADSVWSFPELQEREREYMRRLLEQGKPILTRAIEAKAQRMAAEAKAWAEKVAEAGR